MEAMYEETEVKIITEEVESCYTFMEVSSPKRRKRSKCQGDKADKEKKPRSAFLLYYFDVHQSMQQEFPDLPQSEINKRISESWKMLNVVDKGYYLEKAKLEKEGIDPSSQEASTSADIPGFRKILPRTDYMLLPKSAVKEEGAGGQVELCLDGAGSQVGGATGRAQPVSQEALLSPMALGSEVELSEQCIAIEGLTDETAAALSRSGALQEILSQYSSSGTQEKKPASFVVKEEPAEVVEANNAVGLVMEGRGVGIRAVPQGKVDTAQLVTIIPNQEVVGTKVAGASSVFIVPVVSTVEPDPQQSLKLSIKYTRRGRGNCNTPGCTFSYVTRHKPPYCPKCQQYLGGKWVPAAKRTLAKGAVQSQKVQPQKSPGGSSQPGTQPPEPDKPPKQEVPAAGNPPPPRGGDVKQEASVPQTPAAKSSPAPRSAAGKPKNREKSTGLGPKHPIRAILPAPVSTVQQTQLSHQIQTGPGSRAAFVQWVTVSPDKVKEEALKNGSKAVTVPAMKVPCLKPSTLKQLGQSVKLERPKQEVSVPVNTSQYVVTDKGLKVFSVVSLKHNATTTLDLGLSTARGRGKCKNKDCTYVYKNRHKPLVCPCCGWDLTKTATKKAKTNLLTGPEVTPAVLLDPYQALSSAQRETQRQSTLQLLRRCVQIPESEAELQEAMALIQALNSAQVVLTSTGEEGVAQEHTGWPRFYESAAEHCNLCHFPLFKGGQSSVAGQEDCWLLTDSHIQTATIQLKICLNPQCLALHSFTDIHPGLFNVGNRLLVSLDLLFKIRNQIRQGHGPSQASMTILNSVQNQPVRTLKPSVVTHIQELLCSGYWAFECLTQRDYNDMICGLCGIAPKVEIARRNTGNVLQLKNVEFTWPDFQAPDEHSHHQIRRLHHRPLLPPLMRNAVVINTEKDKDVSDTSPPGDPSVLVRLIHEGVLKPDQMEAHSAEELREVLDRCGAPRGQDSTKEEMVMAVSSLYAHLQNGLATGPQPPAHLTAGKLYKICPHQVVCGSKYMVRGESARDHVDLLVSSRYWPPVYVTDSAQQVALCTDIQYPELANQMWGRNQGCFSDPMGEPEYVSCAELQEQQYSMDLSGVESSQVHPITKSPSRWIVHPGEAGEGTPETRHHALSLCQELEPYRGVVAGLEEAWPDGTVRNKPLAFDNAAYYYLYNRLVDFLTSKDIVSQQIGDLLQGCQPGEVIIRDALYRLGVAQINTEVEPEEEAGLAESV
ncbi:hypothetical protein MATL_G00173640 [Megalops atlanticus]|uniref:HMG box domain-containing protein n=1 Tax=Megalops atlanticus TaxID=7932 RepID=A0A9D3T7D1_MEGAT|nr:hypothetical protein MATL_G00173640 [Megalops atlanticus]